MRKRKTTKRTKRTTSTKKRTWRSTMTRRMRRRTTTRRTTIATRADPARAARRRAGRIAAALLVSAAALSWSTARGATDEFSPGRSVEDAEELIASVVSRYAASRAYEIDFTQESYWALADSTQVTTGTVSVSPPGRISIRYEDGGRIVADGESLKIFVPATGQFFVTGLDSTDVLFDPVGLLSAYAPDADRPFGTPETTPTGVGRPERRLVRLRPRPPAVEPARLDVEIDASAETIRAITAHSTAGDRTRYTLHRTRLDAAVPASAFRLIPPPGAEIVRGTTPYGG
jgi:outer membrane lipoprotein-sorting protein